MNIILSLGTISQTNPNFLAALDRLGADPSVTIKDRYQLALLRNEVIRQLSLFEQGRIDIVRRNGEPEKDVLMRVRDRLAVSPDSLAQNSLQIAQLDRAIEEATKHPGKMSVDADDAERFDRFTKDMSELMSVKFEIPLQEKIVLSPDAKISSKEIAVLIDIVTHA